MASSSDPSTTTGEAIPLRGTQPASEAAISRNAGMRQLPDSRSRLPAWVYSYRQTPLRGIRSAGALGEGARAD